MIKLSLLLLSLSFFCLHAQKANSSGRLNLSALNDSVRGENTGRLRTFRILDQYAFYSPESNLMLTYDAGSGICHKFRLKYHELFDQLSRKIKFSEAYSDKKRFYEKDLKNLTFRK